MIRLALVEDDSRLAKLEKDYIRQVWELEEDLDIKMFDRAEHFLEDVKNGAGFDILIADIELPGMNGIRMGQSLREKNGDMTVIFLTAHDGFALESYQMNARQYILKSEMHRRLPEVLNAAGREICRERKNFRLIQENGELKRLCMDEVLYFSKEGKYVKYTLKKETVRERASLETVLEETGGYPFVKTERGFVVNARFIVKITEDTVYLGNGDAVPVSRRLLPRVKQEITRKRSGL